MKRSMTTAVTSWKTCNQRANSEYCKMIEEEMPQIWLLSQYTITSAIDIESRFPKICKQFNIIMDKFSSYAVHCVNILTHISAASQEIPRILWNPEAHHCIYKHLPIVPILSHINSIHASPSHWLKIHFDIIFRPMPGSSKRSLSVRFSTTLCMHLLFLLYLLHAPPTSSFLMLSRE
jgi:hypothetical protein